jgi:hypothetical protein
MIGLFCFVLAARVVVHVTGYKPPQEGGICGVVKVQKPDGSVQEIGTFGVFPDTAFKADASHARRYGFPLPKELATGPVVEPGSAGGCEASGWSVAVTFEVNSSISPHVSGLPSVRTGFQYMPTLAVAAGVGSASAQPPAISDEAVKIGVLADMSGGSFRIARSSLSPLNPFIRSAGGAESIFR